MLKNLVLVFGQMVSGQAAVVASVVFVPQREPAADSFCKDFQLGLRTRRGVSRLEIRADNWFKILIVATLKYGVKYVSHGNVS